LVTFLKWHYGDMGVFTASDAVQRKPRAAHRRWAARPLQGKSTTTIRLTTTKTLGETKKRKREKERKKIVGPV